MTGRLTYADLGGAAWGAPADAKVGATFTPAATSFQAAPLSAFGPISSRRAGDGKEISRLWAPESPSTDHAVHTPKQARHRREVSLSDMGHLGFVPRGDHSGK